MTFYDLDRFKEPTAIDFATAVANYIEKHKDGSKTLARQFETALTTPQRWADGVAVPHFKLRQIVVDWIRYNS